VSRLIIYLLFLFFICTGCSHKPFADLIIVNAALYAVDTTYTHDAIAIKHGSITAIGPSAEIMADAGDRTEVIDAKGNFVMPGFIEGHGHYSGLGFSLINLNFLNARSWEEIVDSVEARAQNTKKGSWIIGRGWHQEKWDSLPGNAADGYPVHRDLSEKTADHPVLLYHASGHSAFANRKAMELAGVYNAEIRDPAGGRIVRDASGVPTGVFEERAMEVLRNAHHEYEKGLDEKSLDSVWHAAIVKAEDECLRRGITSFQDAGSSYKEIRGYKNLAEQNKMRVRLYAMLRHPVAELEGKAGTAKVVNAGRHFFTCNSIKSEVDGALGAFGAWMLKPYNDKPGFTGQNTTDIYDVKKIADIAIQEDMQFCVHAIGDRANRVVLDIYEGVMSAHPDRKDLRWRIEHAQHLNTADIPRFSKLGIIASMQGIHCTSDAPFVVKRLGVERARTGAYPWRSLIDNGVIIANGTDAPVEDVDPIKSFYASVTRKRADTGLEFFPEQRMTREEAVRSYTLGNAYAAFEEKHKGSLRVGKFGDIVILSKNLITCTDEEILEADVLYTIVDGKILYKKP
jgi:predicted amidohydrolase YtcJ